MKKILTLSNAIYAFTIAFALGVLLKVYLDRSRLPEGICPTDYNDRWIYASIIFLISGIIVTSIMEYRAKKKKTIEKAEKTAQLENDNKKE